MPSPPHNPWTSWATRRRATVEGARVRLHVGPWPVLLDSQAQGSQGRAAAQTRLRLAFRMTAPVDIHLYPRDFLPDLGQGANCTRLVLHHAAFDHRFVLRTTDPGLARDLLTHGDICDRLSTIPDLHLTIHPLSAGDIAILDMQTTRLITDPTALDPMADTLGAMASRLLVLRRASAEALRIR